MSKKTDPAIIIEIVSKRAKVDSETVDKDSMFADDLGLDSLEVMDIFMDLESKLALPYDSLDYEELDSVGDVVRKVQSLKKEMGVPA